MTEVRGGPGTGAGPGWVDDVRRVVRSDPMARAGLVVLAVLLLSAAFAPVLSPYDPAFQGDLRTERFAPPSWEHPLGTDQAARDVLSRVLHGARISLGIGLLATALSVTLGTAVGAVAGYLGGWIDTVLMRTVDVFLAMPRLVLLLVAAALFRPSLGLMVLLLGFTLWPSTARIVRGEVLSLRERTFVLAGRALGFSRARILFGHIVPNAITPILVVAALGIGDTIVLEAGLSFLGLGVEPPTPSWGGMVDDGRAVMRRAWWLSTFPGLAIAVTVLSFNLVGDALRDALDPGSGR